MRRKRIVWTLAGMQAKHRAVRLHGGFLHVIPARLENLRLKQPRTFQMATIRLLARQIKAQLKALFPSPWKDHTIAGPFSGHDFNNPFSG